MENGTIPYEYTPLQSDRHIRLLEVENRAEGFDAPKITYRIIQKELIPTGDQVDFEAVSYTWGNPERVGTLAISNATGSIGLTRSLADALPYLAKHSQTKLLWLDQICINQNDNAEKAHQVAMMSKIYEYSRRVIVWLGLEDEDSHLCKEWLKAIEEYIGSITRTDRVTRGNPEYDADIRLAVIRTYFNALENDHMYPSAIRRFSQRPWFSRGWIVQEYLLARTEIFLTGDLDFSFHDLADLDSIPPDRQNPTESFKALMQIKMYPFQGAQPLRFLRLIYAVNSEFKTTELGDKLYSLLGMIEELRFVPDYGQSIKSNFTRFAAGLAEQFGSVDFLSLWAANLDPLVPNTAPEFLGFPSWVPSWSWLPFQAPFRLAVGGIRYLREDVLWNAAKDRKHIHDQPEDAAETSRLWVRGRVVDTVEAVNHTKFVKYWDVDDERLAHLLNQVKMNLPGLEDWTLSDMVRVLQVASWNGKEPDEPAEEVLKMKENLVRDAMVEMAGVNERLGLCLTMGRGRRFMKTESGRIGLAPSVGSRGRDGDKKGSLIVILHGCIVPIMLEAVDEERREFRVVGDCYVEGIMHGEAVTWEENDTETFILV